MWSVIVAVKVDGDSPHVLPLVYSVESIPMEDPTAMVFSPGGLLVVFSIYASVPCLSYTTSRDSFVEKWTTAPIVAMALLYINTFSRASGSWGGSSQDSIREPAPLSVYK